MCDILLSRKGKVGMISEKTRRVVIDILDVLCLVGVIYCSVVTFNYRFTYPDLSETRLFLDMLHYNVFGFCGAVVLSRHFL